MSIFNSLGSNYNLKIALRVLLRRHDAKVAFELKSYLDEKYQGETILLYKGREALELALHILGLSESTYVAINGYTCYAVYQAVINANYHVEYIDITESDFNFSPAGLEEKLQSNPLIKVVVVQNTLGYPCDIEKIAVICKQKNIILIEDLAHSVGTIYRSGREAGTVGDFVVVSFSQDKIIDGISGGALIIRNERYKNVHDRKLSRVNRGWQYRDKFYPLLTVLIRKTHGIGFGKLAHASFRMAGLLSATMREGSSDTLHDLPQWYCDLIYEQFRSLEKELRHRRDIAEMYHKALNPRYVQPSIAEKIGRSTNIRFPILIKNRDALIAYLKKHRIYVSDIWYDAPIAPKKYMHLAAYDHQCPVSEKISDEMLNLPTHKNISKRQAEIIARKINTWLPSPQR